MDFADRLNVLQAAEGDSALLALTTVELAYSELPIEEREAIRRALLAAAVPHWFDPRFLVALLAVDEYEAERLHKLLCALTAVEPFSARGERAMNVHESARQALREHLRKSDPGQWRTLAERARAHVTASSRVHARIEALHHLFAINQEAAAAECEALDRDLIQKPEWRQALAISLSEVSEAGWLQGSALVESLLIPLQVRSQRGETARLETEARAVVELAERYPHSSGLARAQCLVGDVYQSHGRLDAALASFQESLAIQEDPSITGWQYDLAAVHFRLGNVYQIQGRLDAALASFQKSVAIIERLVQNDPSNPKWQHDLNAVHYRLGGVYQSQGRLDAALASFQKSVTIIERLVQDDPSNPKWQHELGAAHIHLGDMYQSQDRRVAARASFQKSLTILEQLVQEDPSNTGWQRDLSIAHSRLPIHMAEQLLAAEQEGKLQSLGFIRGKPLKIPSGLAGAISFASSNSSQHAALPIKLKLQITSARDLQRNSRIVIEKLKDVSFGKKFKKIIIRNRRHSFLGVNSDLQACILSLIECYKCYIYIDAASPAIVAKRLDSMIKSLVVLNDQIDACISFEKPLERQYIATALRSHTRLFKVATKSLSTRKCNSQWQQFVLSAIAVWNNN
jgi:tetratricopeptide (TPR) repeat protein